MRVLLTGVLVVIGVAGFAIASAGDSSLSPGAAEVLAAWRDGTGDGLAALAEREDPDRWLVADELLLHGHPDAALAFALASPPRDATRLADYVRGRARRKPDPAVRDALEVAKDASSSGDRMQALKALRTQRGRGDLLEQSLVQIRCADLLSSLERADEAAELFLGAGDTAEKLGWYAMAVRGYQEALLNSYAVADFEATLTAGHRLLAVEQGGANRAGIARALMFVGAASIEVGDHVAAHRYLDESLATYNEIGDEDGAAWVLNNLSAVYIVTGELGKAERALEQALTLARRVGNEYREACVLGDLGGLYSSLADYARARDLLTTALGMYRAMHDDEGIVQCLGSLGHVYLYLGEHDKSVRHLEEALTISRRLGLRLFISMALNNLGCTLREKGELERAIELEEEAVEIARTIGHTWTLGHALQSLADALTAVGRYEEANDRLEESLSLAVQSGSPDLLMTGHRGLAEMWLAKKDFARAVHESVRAMEFARELLTGLGLRQGAVARDRMAHLYEIAIEAAARWGRAGALFTALEGARAGALLEVLENREEIRATSIPPALVQSETTARRELNLATVRYRRAVAKGERREIRKQRASLDRAREALHGVVGRIQRDVKNAAQVLYPLTAEVDELQEALGEGEAFVIFSLLGPQARALLVTAASSRAIDLGESRTIGQAARRMIEDPKSDSTAGVTALRKMLLAPLDLPADCRRLLVSPDGVLGFVPFSLLAPEQEVVYVPSATAYLVLRAERGLHGKGVLALGNPEYPAGGVVTAGEGAHRGMALLPPLPASGAEAKAVGDVVLLGKKATRSGLLIAVKQRRRWGAIHLACHALLDSARPMRSALALSGGNRESGLLTCAEIFGLKIPADLAVLSACETGRGAVYRTEGIVGLTQAFMLAGSPRVLVSLWKVDDEATSALMVKFYELWRPRDGSAGLSAATALKRAQEHVRAQKEWSHPYYWAAWVLWGLPD